ELYSRSFVFFFFQAEDGIRDRTVTGVQTCALPISSFRKRATVREAVAVATVRMQPATLRKLVERGLPKGDVLTTAKVAGVLAARSEERRVGKECSGRGWGGRGAVVGSGWVGDGGWH